MYAIRSYYELNPTVIEFWLEKGWTIRFKPKRIQILESAWCAFYLGDLRGRLLKPPAMRVRLEEPWRWKRKFLPNDIMVLSIAITQKGGIQDMSPKRNDDTSSLSHTRWNCQYHIVFVPKYRRKVIFAKLRSDIGKYLRRLCQYKGVEIVEAHAAIDHIHMLVKIPPKIAVSSFMGYRNNFV